MKEGDKVITKKGEGQSEMLGSSFLAFALPCANKEELDAQLASIRSLHHKANHIPYGFRLDGQDGFSEDGEPSGSSGRPLLEFLRAEDAYGLLAVARYFGGTKLGVGNLRRMVLEAGKQAYGQAEISVVRQLYAYDLEVDYAAYDSLTRLSSRLDFVIANPEFGEMVKVKLISDSHLNERLEAKWFRLNPGEPFLDLVKPK